MKNIFTQTILENLKNFWMFKNPEAFFKKRNLLDEYTQNKEFFESKETLLKYCFANGLEASNGRQKSSKCLTCGNNTKFHYPYGYSLYCCSGCVSKSKVIKEKKKELSLAKYGVDNPSKSKEVSQKMIMTKLEKYGNALGNLEKLKETNLRKYGVENVMKNTTIQNDLKNSLNSLKTRLKRKNSHYDNLEISNDILKDRLANLYEKFVRENFIENNKFEISKFCEYFITTRETAHRYKKLYNITENNNIRLCKDLVKILNFLDFYNIEYSLNDRSVINPLELDIFIKDYNLAIEYNGLLFHSVGDSVENSLIRNIEKDYHLKKTLLCRKKGIQLLHIFEGEDIDLWLSVIKTKLSKNDRIYARNTTIREISSKEATEFLEYNHLQGSCNASVKIGLFFENVLISVMTFSKSRFNNNYQYELIRFASKRNISICGGGSKLLKYFEKNYNPKNIISYANLRWSNGNFYRKLNFQEVGSSNCNYFYFKNGEKYLYNRIEFQKHKLKDKLEFFDGNLSECENMFKNGYRKIYDCGNLIFCKKF